MLTEADIQKIDQNLFEILNLTERMVWIRSRASGEEFIITDINVGKKHPTKFKGYQWHVLHRHNEEELCHYHANEKSVKEAMKHIIAHDRRAAYRKQHAEEAERMYNSGINII